MKQAKILNRFEQWERAKLIPVTLELGGKSANMIFDDCDLEQAVEGLSLIHI